MNPRPPHPLVEIDNLSISYRTSGGPARAVRNVSLAINAGETIGLVGETGCGKSTLAYALLGDLGEGGRVDCGQIRYRGADLLELGSVELRKLRGAEIGMVYQHPGEALNPSLTIGTQLLEALSAHGKIDRRAARQTVIESLERIHLPDAAALLKRYPHQLSGGQQQRVLIAMALLPRPTLLVLDEPTTGLDVTVEASFLDLLEEIRAATETTIVYVAHNLGVIARICERVGVMYAGELVELADVDELFRAPKHPYTAALLECIPRARREVSPSALRPIPGNVPSPLTSPMGCAFAPRCRYAEEQCESEHPALAPVAEQHDSRCFFPEAVRVDVSDDTKKPFSEISTDGLAPIFSAKALRAYYRKPGRSERGASVVKAVDGVSIDVVPGEIVAIVGESGCGKSTLASTIVGLRTPSEGQLQLLAEDVARLAGRRSARARRALQMVFQDHGSTLNPSLRVRHIVGRPLRLFDIARRPDVRTGVTQLLAAVGLSEDFGARRPGQLSGGQRQRVAIARAFAGEPEIVVCDEVTSALDVSVQASILNLLLELRAERRTSLIFISHDLGVVRYIADRVFVMYLGRFVESGSADEVFYGPNHPYTEALFAAIPSTEPASATQPRLRLSGNVPSALSPPSGCPFHTRCPRKVGRICEEVVPPRREPTSGHAVWCHIPAQDLPYGRSGRNR